jgi:hypothetical protein
MNCGHAGKQISYERIPHDYKQQDITRGPRRARDRSGLHNARSKCRLHHDHQHVRGRPRNVPEGLLDFLVRATNETIRYVPGFVSANLHVNFDRTEVVNYAQWLNRRRSRPHAKTPESSRSCASNFKLRTVLRRSNTSCVNPWRRLVSDAVARSV